MREKVIPLDAYRADTITLPADCEAHWQDDLVVEPVRWRISSVGWAFIAGLVIGLSATLPFYL